MTNGALVGMEAPLIDYLHANFDVRVTSGTVNDFLMNLDPNLLQEFTRVVMDMVEVMDDMASDGYFNDMHLYRR